MGAFRGATLLSCQGELEAVGAPERHRLRKRFVIGDPIHHSRWLEHNLIGIGLKYHTVPSSQLRCQHLWSELTRWHQYNPRQHRRRLGGRPRPVGKSEWQYSRTAS